MSDALITINKWSEVFENHESRKRQSLGWYFAPSGCNSSGYIELITEHRSKGIEAFAVFHALCGVMATLPKDRRGAFIKSNGEPMSLKQLSALTHIPDAVIMRSLELLSSEGVAWVRADCVPDACRKSAASVPKNSGFVEGMGWDGMGQGRDYCAPAKAVAPDRFEEFWNAYDLKKDRGKCEPLFKKAIKDGADPQEIIDAARRYAEEMKLPGAPSKKYPQGWLSGKRWLDEPEPDRERQKRLNEKQKQDAVHSQVSEYGF